MHVLVKANCIEEEIALLLGKVGPLYHILYPLLFFPRTRLPPAPSQSCGEGLNNT